MPAKRPTISRTFNPIHFEDLDPHRFEDLVRELVYDFRDWQSIEATGRSGSDSGYDVRAYEKVSSGELENVDADADEVMQRPMEGRMWMVQCKREQQIGPKKLKSILSEIDKSNPPYGFILAASANFSKGVYDVFRESLRDLGVMEFFLWGKSELEDMLHQPKNDRILFTFFGVSLLTRRRSRVAEVRSSIVVKNKLSRAFGDYPVGKRVLIRDLNDIEYPYRKSVPDFDKNPRWLVRDVVEYDPSGLVIKSEEFFAYLNREGKQYDLIETMNFADRDRDDSDEYFGRQRDAQDIWDFVPQTSRARFIGLALIKFEDILIVDDKGDSLNDFPHIYFDFTRYAGPFKFRKRFIQDGFEKLPESDLLKVSFFSEAKFRMQSRFSDRSVVIDADSLNELRDFRNPPDALYALDGRYSFLEPGDIVSVGGEGENKVFVQVTSKEKWSTKEYANAARTLANISHIKRQTGWDGISDVDLWVFEFRRASGQPT